MAKTSLLSLPTELLDKVFRHLTWDRTQSLVPYRPDAINISLTCTLLRQAVIPLLFQHVTLKLRWVGVLSPDLSFEARTIYPAHLLLAVLSRRRADTYVKDGALIEPALYRVRKEYPHLARHVRSVYIRTEFHQYEDPDFLLKAFVVPEGLSDWVNPAALPDDPTYAVEVLHRQRIYTVARSLFDDYEISEECVTQRPQELQSRMRSFFYHILGRSVAPSTHLQTGPGRDVRDTSKRGDELLGGHTSRSSLRNDYHQTSIPTREFTQSAREMEWDQFERLKCRIQLDALVIVMLCLPPTVTSIAFEAHPRKEGDKYRNAFALHVASKAFQIFGGRLEHLAMVTSPAQSQSRSIVPRRPDLLLESSIVTPEVLQGLEMLNSLTLSDEHNRHRYLTSAAHVQWQSIGSSTLVHLELWNLGSDSHDLPQFIKSFCQLRSVALQNILLIADMRAAVHQRLGMDEDPTLWLRTLIEIRKHMPALEMRLGALKQYRGPLPQSAIRWLSLEAVPAGCSIDFDRETRLGEDFESFMPLWVAEDSDRGYQAQEARKDGSLVDQAMTSRWNSMSHLRQ